MSGFTREQVADRPRKCPWCGHELDSAIGTDGNPPTHRPQAGDFSICIECVGVSIFTDDERGLRRAEPREIVAMDDETFRELRLAQERAARARGLA